VKVEQIIPVLMAGAEAKRRSIMRRSVTAAAVAALLASSFTMPAFAAWDRIGSVQFSWRNNHDVMDYARMNGNAVGLTARNSDVTCDSVTATFGNGRTREIFNGELRRGRTVTLDLPGGERNVDRVDFYCRPLDRRQARVDVAMNMTDRYSPQDAYQDTFRDFGGRR
jgi:hypothetical protein